MLNNMKLGKKIGIQLSSLILMILLLGGIAAMEMKTVSDHSSVLSSEHVPSVKIAVELERNLQLSNFNIRTYSLSEDKSYYDKGVQYLENIAEIIRKAKEMGGKFRNFTSFSDSVMHIENDIMTYEKLMKETFLNISEIEINREKLKQASAIFTDNCNKLLLHQTETLETEIAAGLDAERLQGRLQKITRINNIIDLLNRIRLATFQYHISQGETYIRTARQSFEEMEPLFQSMLSLTELESSKKMIAETQAAALTCNEAVNKVFENQQALNVLNTKRFEAADEVLEEAREITENGMEETGKISKDNVSVLSNALKIILVGLLICIATGIVLSVIITRGITLPISRAAELAAAIAQGDMTRKMEVSSKNEIGELAEALNRSSGDLAAMLLMIKENSQGVASASQELSMISAQLASGTEQSSAGISAMASAAEEMSANAQSVSSTAEQMSAIMNSIASAIEEMSMSIHDIAQNAKEGARISVSAMELSENARETINNLGLAATEIGEVTEVIRQIAQQTNLLALNATIEAASAGEAGKGFAVVANEIKELARQSAGAAENIAKKIRGVQTSTQEVIASIGDVSGIIEKINDASAVIRQAAEQQTAVSNDISSNVQQANEGVANIAASIGEIAKGSNDVASSTGEAAKNVNEIAKSSQQVNISSEDLAKLAGELQKMTERFKTERE